MTADKKRLMTLLCEAHNISCDAKLFDDATYAQQLGKEADHLLANGVTFQKRIPVSERLPELMENVLLLLTCDDYAVGYRCDKFWRVAWTNSKLDNDEVTHWMPLPEPPKEEKNNG